MCATDRKDPQDPKQQQQQQQQPVNGHSPKSTKPVLILGAGWVGSRLAQSLENDGIPVIVTNRPGTDAQAKPPYFRPVELTCPPFQRVDFI